MPSVESTFDVIRELFERAGLRLIEDVSHAEAFGSRNAAFQGNRRRLRLIWDGKEEWFALEEQSAEWADSQAWQEVITVCVDRNSITPSSLESLVEAVKRQVSGATA
jgi:hypothetical protein